MHAKDSFCTLLRALAVSKVVSKNFLETKDSFYTEWAFFARYYGKDSLEMRIYAHFLRAKDSFGGKDAKNIAVRTRQDRPPPLIFLLVWGQKPTPKRRATLVIQRDRILARPAHRIARAISPSCASRSQLSNGTPCGIPRANRAKHANGY